jgi:hypothetical protein
MPSEALDAGLLHRRLASIGISVALWTRRQPVRQFER